MLLLPPSMNSSLEFGKTVNISFGKWFLTILYKDITTGSYRKTSRINPPRLNLEKRAGIKFVCKVSWNSCLSRVDNKWNREDTHQNNGTLSWNLYLLLLVWCIFIDHNTLLRYYIFENIWNVYENIFFFNCKSTWMYVKMITMDEGKKFVQLQ